MGRRVLDLLAEDLAYDDLLGVLDEDMRSGRISVETFVKEVRDASRKQFISRELRKRGLRVLQIRRAREAAS